MEIILSINNLAKEYNYHNNKLTIFKNSSFKVKSGEFVVLLGPSGSGKSTLLNIIGMLKKPTRGTVDMNGKNSIHTQTHNDQAQLRLTTLGFVYQGFNLIPFLSALKNVQLPLMLANSKIGKTEMELKATELLNKVGLGERLYHLPSQLSFGEQQRVALARSLINDPAIVLADEPTGSLDLITSKEIIALMKQLNQDRKIAFLVATHDEAFVPIADKVLVINNAKIEEEQK